MLEILSAGYDSLHSKDFCNHVPGGVDHCLLVIVSTPSFFVIDNNKEFYPPHQAVLYLPGETIHYGAVSDNYSDHWLVFRTDNSAILSLSQTGAPFSIYDSEYFRTLLKLITWETYANKPSELILEGLVDVLFDKLKGELSSKNFSRYEHELLKIRRSIAASPERPWSVDYIAEKTHISTGYFQSLYKQQFGCSCIEDIIRFRLNKAKDLLVYTSQTSAEIAEQCGYQNTEHFCRQFRKKTGMTPNEYRHSKRV